MSHTGFKNPIEEKDRNKFPEKFKAPVYDERTSCYVNAGDTHGVGHRVPVGHEGAASLRAPCLPFGKVNTMRVDEK